MHRVAASGVVPAQPPSPRAEDRASHHSSASSSPPGLPAAGRLEEAEEEATEVAVDVFVSVVGRAVEGAAGGVAEPGVAVEPCRRAANTLAAEVPAVGRCLAKFAGRGSPQARAK